MAMTDKQIGFEACVEAIGKSFYETNKENSVFACSVEENGLWCFLGLNTSESADGELKLTNGKEWEYSSSCYVRNGVAHLDKVHAPAIVD
jgi:hypothetical protein